MRFVRPSSSRSSSSSIFRVIREDDDEDQNEREGLTRIYEMSYYDILVDGQVNKDAAWYYPEPNEAASNIKGHVAFWKGVILYNAPES